MLERARTQAHKYTQKHPETTFTQKRTSTCASSYMCTNTGAAVIWGMLNIYLSCLPGWLHQSALSLGLSINLTFKDSSPLGSYSHSETNCTHLYCNSSTSFLCYFFHVFFWQLGGVTQYTGACQFRQAFGRETNTWTCNAVALNDPMLKSPLQCTRKIDVSECPRCNWLNDVHFRKEVSWQCAAVTQKCSNVLQTASTLLMDLHEINNVDAQKAKQRPVSSCEVAMWNTGWWLRTVHLPQIPVVCFSK